MSLVESLRSLLRALTIHEKELFKVATDNLFMLNFIRTQFDESRSDPLKELEEAEGHEEIDGGNDSDQEFEGAAEVNEADWSGKWESAWNDEDESNVVKFDEMIESSVNHFSAPAIDSDEVKVSKKSKKSSVDNEQPKESKRSTRSKK